MKRRTAAVMSAGFIAALAVGVAIVTAPAFVLVSGTTLTYNGQVVTLRGENFNNEPALACCGGPDIAKINANAADYLQASTVLGENAIRFGMDWHWYNTNPSGFFTVVDQHVAWAKANDLWLIPVVYEGPGSSFGGFCCQDVFWNSAANQQTLTAFWSAFATHYANEPTIAGYDIINEPQDPLNNLTRYQAWAQSTYDTITAADPNHFLVVEAMGNPNELPTITGSRILWSQHCYAAVGTNGCNYAGPDVTNPEKLPFLWGEIGTTQAQGTAYVPADLTTFNQRGVSWTHFVMHETGYGLYQNWGAGDFTSPYTAMVQAVQAATVGAVRPAATPVPSVTPSVAPTVTLTPTGAPTATPTALSPITVTQQCTTSAPTVSAGLTLSATGVIQNTSAAAISLLDVVLAGRPPGGTNAGGPYADFHPTSGSITLAAGASYTLTASRAFTSADPVGTWRCFLTYETTDVVYHDGQSVNFTVTLPPTPSPTPTATPTPSPTPLLTFPCVVLINGVMTASTCTGTHSP